MSTTGLRDVDLGVDGVSGAYERFIKLTGQSITELIVLAGAWLYLTSLPPNADYQITDTITATMVIKLILALWLFKIVWGLARALASAARWLGQESAGMQWADDCGEKHRVVFYRGSDQVLRLDEAGRAQLQTGEEAGRHYRRHALLRDGIVIAILCGCYYYLPLGLAWLHDQLGPGWQYKFDHWDMARLVPLILLLFAIVPRAVDFLMVVVESAVYATGAQFMPGAKIRDA